MSPTPSPRLRPLAAGLLAAALLAGCASSRGLAPQSSPASPDALSASRSFKGHALSAAAFPAQDWWRALGDAQLDGLIAEALQGTPTLQAADARLRQAQAQAGVADAARKATLSGTAQVSSVQLPETMVGPSLGGSLKASGVLMANFGYDLDLWGGKRAAWEEAVDQVHAAQIDAQAARLSLSSAIVRNYISLAEAFSAQDVARDERERSARLLELDRQRAQAGLDSRVGQHQSESALASARQQEQAAQQQIDALRNVLAELLGKGPDRGLDIARPGLLSDGAASAAAPAIPSELPSELLGHRPDVVAARWRVEAAQRGIDGAKAAFKPSINLTALVGLVSPSLSDLFTSDALFGLGGPALSLPLFDGGNRRAKLSARDAAYDLAVADYDQKLVSALRDVTDALQSARSLDARIDSTRTARAAAQSAFDLAQTRYRAGIGTRLDVLAAQKPLLQLDQQLASLRAQRLTAAVDLDQALGGGLPLQAPSTPSPIADASTTP